LTSFDTQFGLPAANLTVAYPGGTPQTNSDWAIETDMDVEWAHAIAPQREYFTGYGSEFFRFRSNKCHQLCDRSRGNLVSMSWGGPEFSGETGYTILISTTLVYILASSGDSGEGISWPAVSPYVSWGGWNGIELKR